MNKRKQTLSVLVRWREFQQALARGAYQASVAEARRADHAVGDAHQTAITIQQYKAAVSSEALLDLDRLSLVGELEDHAWDRHARAMSLREDAVRVRDAALVNQLDARARLNVAHTGHERVERECEQAQEIREFDRLTALLASGAQR